MSSVTAYSGPSRESSEGVSLLALLTAGLAVIFGIAALGFSLRNNDGGGGGGGAAASQESGKSVATADVFLTDFKIRGVPDTFPAGPIELKIRNNGSTPHTLVIDGVARTDKLAVGKSVTLSLGSLEAGSYTWYCDIAGHKEAGMTGTFTVTGSSATATGTATAAAATSAASETGAETVNTLPPKDEEAVDREHQKVVQAYLTGLPAKTEGLGGQKMKPSAVENGVNVFNLTAKAVQWEVAPGKKFEAWTYNGAVPGPELHVKQGETIKVRLKNELPESTSIHWHGLELTDNKQDGVTFVTQDPIKPGQTYEYTITPLNCGSHMYHSHHAADAQVPLGLLGALIVDCTTTPTPAFYAHDTDYTEILTDGPLGFGINGKGFPGTAPIVAKVGEKTLIRFMNEGLIIHPMHLHGHRMTVVAKDGNFLPAPYEVDTLNIAPGERYDVIVSSLYTGAWAFHCHILTHAESDNGLHGMTTVWAVKPA